MPQFILIIFIAFGGGPQKVYQTEGQYTEADCVARAQTVSGEARAKYPGAAVTFQCLRMLMQ